MIICCGAVVTLAIGITLGINHALHSKSIVECADLSTIGKILAWDPCRKYLNQ